MAVAFKILFVTWSLWAHAFVIKLRIGSMFHSWENKVIVALKQIGVFPFLLPLWRHVLVTDENISLRKKTTFHIMYFKVCLALIRFPNTIYITIRHRLNLSWILWSLLIFPELLLVTKKLVTQNYSFPNWAILTNFCSDPPLSSVCYQYDIWFLALSNPGSCFLACLPNVHPLQSIWNFHPKH